ncbi:MAG: DUF2357 domain-containing protein [Lachnospiraceae bacterium]|nr:DUF2357 domain-containing protein [Lachnospiraceae bacterium]
MENIVAVSIYLDDSQNQRAIIYPSGTSIPSEPTEEIDGLWIYKTDNEQKKVFFEYKESGLNINPLRLKETISYCCKIENYDNLYYPHIKNEKNKLLKLGKEQDRIIFQFVNYLGKSVISFEGSDKSIEFEVVPDKINYEEDYINLTEAIANECSALLHDYTSPTLLSYLQNPAKEANILEQFIFLRKFCNSSNLESLFASIKRNPDRQLVSEEELRPFGRGISSTKFFTNPFSYSRGWEKNSDGIYLPTEVATVHKYDSYDTPANRFIKFALLTFSEVCIKVLNCVSKEDGNKYFPEAKLIIQQIDDILCDSFFDDIRELEMMPVNNQVLEKREGYSQIFNAFAMLYLALQLNWKEKDNFSAEVKNTALLYEYWLFFELRKILIELLGEHTGKDKISSWIPFTRFEKESDGLTLSLAQGRASVQTFNFDNLTVNLYYNKTFSPTEFSNSLYWGSYSRPFRPDYTLAIFPSDCKKETDAIKLGSVSYIHFDAKYRIEDLTQFINSNKKAASESELDDSDDLLTDQEENEFEQEKTDAVINTYKRGDLLKMHTYNDAIRRTIGSYVLYPGNDYNSERNEQASVYDEILPGVGAFAIRPGNKNAGHEAIKEFIWKIINFKSKESSKQSRKEYFENMVFNAPDDKELKTSKTNTSTLNPNLLMVGYIRDSYYKYLQDKGIISLNSAKSIGNDFYFYFHAIKDGKVFTLHKETSIAKYLILTRTSFYQAEIIDGKHFVKLEPFVSEILSSELVSKETLIERLKENCGFESDTKHSAEYYYIVHAKICMQFDKSKISITSDENEMISPFSPKIIDNFLLNLIEEL